MHESKRPNALDLNLDIPWPRRGDVLVTSDGDPGYLVRTGAGDEWETYVTAYRKAAEMLVERTHDMTLSINWLVYPIWYLYRHYPELRLKSLVWDGDVLDGKPVRPLDNEHRLMALWGMCRPAIEKWQNDCPKGDLDAVEETLQQFEAIDPKSQAARYPTDKASMPSGLLAKKINVKTFVETVTRTANFLDATSDVFSNLQQSPE